MKTYKIFISLLLVLIATISWGQTHVQISTEDGVQKIHGKINGVKVKFNYSENIKDIQLSETTVYFLLEHGYISKEDISTPTPMSMPDGSSQNVVKVNIKSLEIAGLTLNNITAHMLFDRDAKVSIGLTALEQFGKVTVDNNKITIYSNSREEELRSKAKRLYNSGSYAAAADCLQEVLDGNGLYEAEFRMLMKSYLLSSQTDKARKICNTWIYHYDKESDYEQYKGEVYQVMGESYLDNMWAYTSEIYGENKTARLWLEKAIAYLKPNTKDYALCYLSLGKATFSLSKQKAGEHFNKALNAYLAAITKTQYNVDKREVRDINLQHIYRALEKYYRDTSNSERAYDTLVRAYFCGDQSAYDELSQWPSLWNAAYDRVYKR